MSAAIVAPVRRAKKLFDPLRLSDRELAATLAACNREAARRSQVAASGLDEAAIIKGQEFAKRAITVAAAGSHSVCLYGGPGVGKTLLRAMALAVGVEATFEVRPCACGWLGSVSRACRCTPAKITTWRRWNRIEADLHVEVMPTPQQEMASRQSGTTAADILAQVERAKGNGQPVGTSADAETIFRYAASELGIDHGQMAYIRAVAATIARMDGEATVGACHASEAIGYRRPRDW